MVSFSPELEKTLHRALNLANERRHEYSTLEHLLLALISDKDAIRVLKGCEIIISDLSSIVLNYVDNDLDNLKKGFSEESMPTAGFQRVIQRSVIHVQSSGKAIVSGENVLIAIFSERESHAAHFLQEVNLTRYAAVNFMASSSEAIHENKNDKVKVPKKRDEKLETITKIRRKISREPVANTTICIAMSRLAHLEIDRLDSYRPNSDDEIKRKENLINLLRLFDEFFALIASQLNVIEESKLHKISGEEAAKSVVSLSEAIANWWNKNNERIVGTVIGMPVFVGAMGFLGSFGLAPIPMATATAATATVCFGAGAVENALKIVAAQKKMIGKK